MRKILLLIALTIFSFNSFSGYPFPTDGSNETKTDYVTLKKQSVSPAAPASPDEAKIFFNNDNKLVYKDSENVEKSLGGGLGSSLTNHFVENFEENKAIDYFQGNGTTTSVAEEEALALGGSKSVRLNQSGASVNDQWTLKTAFEFDISKEEFNKLLALKFIGKTNAPSAAYRIEIEGYNGTTWSELRSPTQSKQDLADYNLHFNKKSDTQKARVSIYVAIADDSYYLVLDNVFIDSAPNKTMESVESEELFIIGQAGYGSVNTKVPYFTNIKKDTTSNLFSYVNNSTSGLTLTARANSRITVEFIRRENAGVSNYAGVTKNISGAITTAFTSYVGTDNFVGYDYEYESIGSTLAQVIVAFDVSAGETFQPHVETASAYQQENAYVRITATRIQSSTVWEGKTSAFETNVYSATTQGFGSVLDAEFSWSWISGNKILLSANFTAGTPTAVEGRLYLPTGFTVASAPNGAVGLANRSSSSRGLTVLANSGNNYVTFANRDSTPINSGVGSGLLGTGESLSLSAIVSVNELQASDVIFAIPEQFVVVDFKDEEKLTGNKYFGSEIYTKSFTGGSLTNGLSLLTGVAKIVETRGTFGFTATEDRNINYNDGTDIAQVVLNTSTGAVTASTSQAWANGYDFTIFYTK